MAQADLYGVNSCIFFRMFVCGWVLMKLTLVFSFSLLNNKWKLQEAQYSFWLYYYYLLIWFFCSFGWPSSIYLILEKKSIFYRFILFLWIYMICVNLEGTSVCNNIFLHFVFSLLNVVFNEFCFFVFILLHFFHVYSTKLFGFFCWYF